MSTKFLVETAPGVFARKTRAEMLPTDLVVFDGPDAFRAVEEAKKRLDDEIAAAGGFDAWRARPPDS